MAFEASGGDIFQNLHSRCGHEAGVDRRRAMGEVDGCVVSVNVGGRDR